MQQLPLPAIEFAAFMAFAFWLFYLQGKSSRRTERPADAAAKGTTPAPEPEEGEHGQSGR